MPAVETSNLKQSMLAQPPNVIISRIGSAPLALASRVKIDGTEVSRLMNGQYSEFYLEPGNHTIAVTYNPLSLQKGDKINVNIHESNSYAYDISSGLSIAFRAKNTSSVLVRLKALNAKDAVIRLERCCEKIDIQPR